MRLFYGRGLYSPGAARGPHARLRQKQWCLACHRQPLRDPLRQHLRCARPGRGREGIARDFRSSVNRGKLHIKKYEKHSILN